MTTVVSTELDWFHKGSQKRGHNDVIGINEHKNSAVKNTSIRVIMFNISSEGAVSFTNVNMVNAFGKIAGINVLPKFCTDEKMVEEGLTKSMTGYISVDDAFEEGAEICILTGWARSKDKHITDDPGYAAASAVLKKAKEHCPIIMNFCGAAEAASYDYHGIESTVYNEKNLCIAECAKADMHKEEKDPIVIDMNTVTHMPMSRYRNLSDPMMLNNDIVVQLFSSEAGVCIARDHDSQMHYILGHPENEDMSIPKEQIRDWKRYAMCEINEKPTDARHVLDIEAEIMFMDYKKKCMAVREINLEIIKDNKRTERLNRRRKNPKPTKELKHAPELTPEENAQIKKSIKNKWRDSFGTYCNGIVRTLFNKLNDGSAYTQAPKYVPAKDSNIRPSKDMIKELAENNDPRVAELDELRVA